MTPANFYPESLDGTSSVASSSRVWNATTETAAFAPVKKQSYVTSGRLLPSTTVRRTLHVPASMDVVSTLRPITAVARVPASRDSTNSVDSKSTISITSTLRPMTAASRVSTIDGDRLPDDFRRISGDVDRRKRSKTSTPSATSRHHEKR